MKTILIIEPSDPVRLELEAQLQKEYRVYTCTNAEEATFLVVQHQPEGLLINLRLPGVDGLYFLEHLQDYRPPVIITMAATYSAYLEQKLLDLNVAYPLITGCPVHAIVHHMHDCMEKVSHSIHTIQQDTVSNHLRILGVPHQGGFEDLRVGTPLFAQNPDMSMTKEFYPAVARLRGRENWKQVEKAIRAAKEAAYENRNDSVWKEYFADTSECPKNRDFIARLAEFVS